MLLSILELSDKYYGWICTVGECEAIKVARTGGSERIPCNVECVDVSVGLF